MRRETKQNSALFSWFFERVRFKHESNKDKFKTDARTKITTHDTIFVVKDRRKAVSEVYLVGNVELMLVQGHKERDGIPDCLRNGLQFIGGVVKESTSRQLKLCSVKWRVDVDSIDFKNGTTMVKQRNPRRVGTSVRASMLLFTIIKRIVSFRDCLTPLMSNSNESR